MPWIDSLFEKKPIQKKASLTIPEGITKEECQQRIAELSTQIDELTQENEELILDKQSAHDEMERKGIERYFKHNRHIISNLNSKRTSYKKKLMDLTYSSTDIVNGVVANLLGKTIIDNIKTNDITISEDILRQANQEIERKGYSFNSIKVKECLKRLGYNLETLDDIDTIAEEDEPLSEVELRRKGRTFLRLQQKMKEFEDHLRKVTEELEEQYNIYKTEEQLRELTPELGDAMEKMETNALKIKNMQILLKQKAEYLKPKEGKIVEKAMPLLAQSERDIFDLRKSLQEAASPKLKPEEKAERYKEIRERVEKKPELKPFVTEVKPTRTLTVEPASLNNYFNKFSENIFRRLYNWIRSKITPKVEEVTEGVDELENMFKEEDIV